MTLSRRRFVHLSAGAAALSAGARIGYAQDAYPSRPIHVIVGFTPGAAADVAARVLSQGAGPILGQQIVVENRPGAGSSIAAQYVAHAANDGYTLFMATLSIITNQIINPNAAVDLTRDFAPVALLESGAIVLVVNPASGIQNVAELIALAKAKPGQVLHATVKGSLPHFASELFAQRAGIELTQVPYQGSPQSVTDVIAGRATMTFSPASSVVGQIAAGKLKALATAAKKRPSALPDVPTMAEAGIPTSTPACGSACWRPPARRGRRSTRSPRPRIRRCMRRRRWKRCASRVTSRSMPDRTISRPSLAPRSPAGRTSRAPRG
jgi:tripartite-type tricarboxylate transporter receptor subunit TctC